MSFWIVAALGTPVAVVTLLDMILVLTTSHRSVFMPPALIQLEAILELQKALLNSDNSSSR